MDDDEYLRQAARCGGLTADALRWAFGSTQPYYHPLPRLSFAVDYQLWRANPRGYHAVNVGLHALNAALVFGLLWTLLGAGTSFQERERAGAALGVALIFAVHPLQVESVAWIASRVQLLCTACELTCLWAYVAGARRWVVAAWFAGALLCKPTAVSLLCAMLAIDYFPLRRWQRLGWGPLLRRKAELLALAAAAAAATLLTESQPGGLLQPLGAATPLQRVCLAVQSLAFYPWKLLWPAWFSPYYPLGLGFSLRPLPVAAAAAFVAAATAVSLWRRRRTPALIAGWGAYAMFILPVSGLMLRGWQAAADRYAYVAILPLLLLGAGAVVGLARRAGSSARAALAVLAAAALAALGWRTRVQTRIWHDDETLWRGVLAHYPDSVEGNEMLAQALLSQDRVAEALACARRAAAIGPSAETQRNLGIALERAGQTEEAIGEYRRALRLSPGFAELHHALALALARSGRAPEAIGQWEEALRLQPDYPEAEFNLALALEQNGRLGDAAEHYRRALQLRPDLFGAHYSLGVILARLGQPEAAMAQWREALRINPQDAATHYDLGAVLEQAGRAAEAGDHYRAALRIDPHFAPARRGLERLGPAR
jgi:tetratricopeptide (TPR) repeat protein